MATIGKKGDDRRHGAVKKRAQVYNATTDRFIKVDAETGRFMDVKDDNKPRRAARRRDRRRRHARRPADSREPRGPACVCAHPPPFRRTVHSSHS
jgi:hypothetical protein